MMTWSSSWWSWSWSSLLLLSHMITISVVCGWHSPGKSLDEFRTWFSLLGPGLVWISGTGGSQWNVHKMVVNKQLDPENNQLLMDTSLPTPTTARVYVNLPEGIFFGTPGNPRLFVGIWNGMYGNSRLIMDTMDIHEYYLIFLTMPTHNLPMESSVIYTSKRWFFDNYCTVCQMWPAWYLWCINVY